MMSEGRVEEIAEQCSEVLREDVAVDRASRVVRNVALVGAVSRNGYRYREEALQGAAGLYRGKPVFLDHGMNSGRSQERSTRDLVGSIVDARYETGRVRGDIQVLETEAGETFLALVESQAPGVGMSHVVRVERGADPKVIESIQEVISVDAVVSPATTSTFRESCHEGELHEEILTLREELQRVERERDQLSDTLREVNLAKERRSEESELNELVRRSGLPGYAVTKVFRELLRERKDPEERQRMLDDRWGVVKQSKRGTPWSVERETSGQGRDDRWIVEVLAGRGR